MVKFYSISSLRSDIDKYKKKDTYTNCESDLCNFFLGKPIQEIFSLPILLAPNDNFRYIKSRVTNSRFNTGKSGCYRLYYYVDLINESVYLMGYYPKTGKYGRGDLTDTEEKNMIETFKKEKKGKLLIQHDIENDFVCLEAEQVRNQN